MKLKLLLNLGVSVAACWAIAAQAQSYPSKPIRVIVPFAAGGGIDLSTRIIAERLSVELGQPVVVENKPGAGGVVGGQALLASPADGYTLLAASPGAVTGPVALGQKLPYDPTLAFVPIAMVGTSPLVIAAHPKAPYANLKEIVQRAKEQPGKVAIASGALGTSTHMVGQMFSALAGVRLDDIPYKGVSGAIVDAVGGHVELLAADTSVIPFLSDGRLKGIAVTSPSRFRLLPDVPTAAEQGLPGFEMTNWHAWFTATGTPRDVVLRLNQALKAAIAHPATATKLTEGLIDPVHSSPEALGDYVKADIQRWRQTATTMGIKIN